MHRREFLGGAAGAAAAGIWEQQVAAQSESAERGDREFYLLRKYQLTSSQSAGCDKFLETVMLPALERQGYAGVGAFALEYGPETPAIYLLLRHTDPAKLLRLETDLLRDAEFVSAAKPFRTAPALSPAFQRVEDSLLRAFDGHPRLTVPANGKRLLQMRTYESPSMADYLRKVEMFHSGEFEIFAASGMPAVFYAHAVIAPRMPSLTYMLRFDSLADLAAGWKRFGANPEWKKLQADPRFAGEPLVSNITNLVLSPKSYSAI